MMDLEHTERGRQATEEVRKMAMQRADVRRRGLDEPGPSVGLQRGVSPLPVRVARRADDGEGVLTVFQNGAGDMTLGIKLMRPPEAADALGLSVTFAPFMGGGRSPRVRAALIQLQHAIQEQNDQDPHGAG